MLPSNSVCPCFCFRYEGEEFVEEVEEDYIVNEVNGMLTYGYAETASLVLTYNLYRLVIS